MPTYQVKPIQFLSHGDVCRGDLYLPSGSSNPPIVIMGHGFAAERSFALGPYAEAFAQRGLAVMLFDYRCFGESDGTPRNYVDPHRHLQDWQTAVSFIRTHPDVDGSRLALWGSSFGGGHVLVTAAREAGITAVVAQVPYVDSITTSLKLGPRFLLQAVPHGLRDLWRMATGQPPHFVKVIAPPDQFGVMNTHDSDSGYRSIIPAGSDWQNQCPARILVTFALYRPIHAARRIACPALLISGLDDSLIDPKAVARTASRIPNAELVELPVGHFDVYHGDALAQVIEKQAQFLVQHLQPQPKKETPQEDVSPA